jgi:hypothetical protein
MNKIKSVLLLSIGLAVMCLQAFAQTQLVPTVKYHDSVSGWNAGSVETPISDMKRYEFTSDTNSPLVIYQYLGGVITSRTNPPALNIQFVRMRDSSGAFPPIYVYQLEPQPIVLHHKSRLQLLR